MSTEHKPGGEVDAMCTKCEMVLAHTIIAMVGTKVKRVKCNTCQGEHVYRGIQAATPKKPSAKKLSAKADAKEKIVVGFLERVAARDPSSAKMYSPRTQFAVDDLMNHPTFGLGIVSAVRADKVDVAFKADIKTLVHGRGGDAPAEKPAFKAPAGKVNGPADKPQVEGAPAPSAPAAQPAEATSDDAGEQQS